jgi:alpha-1,2-mannosyltransferase
LARDLSLSTRTWLGDRAPWAGAAAWVAWALLFAIISILILAGSDHSVVSAYRDASVQWFSRHDIYTDSGHGFLYLPVAALLFAPFAWLPTAGWEIAWRFVGIAGFAIGVHRLCKIAAGPRSEATFALMTLASLPPALACARNGQSTLIMSGLMMLACVDLAECRRGRAVLWASLAVAFKPLAIVMLLLAPFLDRRLVWRTAVGLAVILGVPFLTAPPGYVVDQYVKCIQMFRASSYCGIIELWAQPFSVLALLGLNLSESMQTATRVVAAGGAIALCVAARLRLNRERAAEYLLAISTLYILLFNPRTENNTYAMLGPVMGLSLIASLTARRPNRVQAICLSITLLLISAGDAVVRPLSGDGEHIWLNPSLAVLYAVYLVQQLFFRMPEATASSATQPVRPLAAAIPAPHLPRSQSPAGVR